MPATRDETAQVNVEAITAAVSKSLEEKFESIDSKIEEMEVVTAKAISENTMYINNVEGEMKRAITECNDVISEFHDSGPTGYSGGYDQQGKIFPMTPPPGVPGVRTPKFQATIEHPRPSQGSDSEEGHNIPDPKDLFAKEIKPSKTFEGNKKKLREFESRCIDYFSSRRPVVRGWLNWARSQKETVNELKSRSGMALQMDRAIFAALKTLTTDEAWPIVTRAEPKRGFNIDLDKAMNLDGLDANIPTGFEAWRLLCRDCAQIHESTGTGHMMKALTLTQASNRDALKGNMNQVAEDAI